MSSLEYNTQKGDVTKEGKVKTSIPARMDRLPWSRWHWLVVVALGITWILDGLEVTIVGSITSILKSPQTLQLNDIQASSAGTAYLIGTVIGALVFGHLTDRFGRKKLFMLTLLLYLGATVATAFSFTYWWFFLCRVLTGAGIGGEYSAINSAIDELIPARARGWTDIVINSTWWVGTAVGASANTFLLNPHLFPLNLGWRLAFALGAMLGLAVLLIRRYVPESPRWLMIHGHFDKANTIVDGIEQEVKKENKIDTLPEVDSAITIHPRGTVSFLEIARTMLKQYPQRSLLGFSLMIAQAFLYNAIFFTYALVLTTFYHIPATGVAIYQIPFAIGNVLGPLLMGRLFDTVGRRSMISFTFITSAILLAISGWMFSQGLLNATTQTIAWSVIFFFASAGSSSAYLTVSEIFPLETRALAIAFFYAVSNAIGGTLPPLLFGYLIQTGKAINVFYGDLIGTALMLTAGITEILLGVKAEQQSLESVAQPLSAVSEEEE